MKSVTPYNMSMTSYLKMMFPTEEEYPPLEDEIVIGKIKRKRLSLETKKGKRKLDCRIVKDYFDAGSLYYEDGHITIPQRVDDILHGVARLDGGSERPLNKIVIFELITPCDYLTVPEVMEQTGLSERQAQKYFNACVIAVRAIEKEIKLNTI